MEKIEVTARLREKTGKSAARKTRREGDLVPAVCYGKNASPVHIEISTGQLKKAISTDYKINTLINLKITSPEKTMEKTVLLKDVQKDVFGKKIMHVDFIEVSNNRPVRVKVPVKLVGRSRGVVEGGIMQHIIRDLEMKCLPQDIPVAIEYDVTEMGIGDAIHVKDLKIPEKARVLVDKDRTVAVVVEVKEEVTAAPAVAATAEGEAPSAEGATPAAEGAAAKTPTPAEGTAPAAQAKPAQPEKKK